MRRKRSRPWRYVAKQTTISFGYDASLEIVTKDHQKLMLANSGVIDLSGRQDSRQRGWRVLHVAMIFDGKTLTIVHKDAQYLCPAATPGTLIISS